MSSSTDDRRAAPGAVDEEAPPERIVLRPIGSALSLGLVGFAVGAFVSSALAMHWIAAREAPLVAAVLLGFTAPLQLLAAVLGFLARDTSAATAQGILAATWGTFGVILLVPGGGPTSVGLGVFMLADAFAVALVAAASMSVGRFFAAILVASSARYLLEGLTALGGGYGVSVAAGLVGLAQAALGSYGALALLLESATRAPVLPLVRSAAAERSIEQRAVTGLERAKHDPGVRSTL